MWQISCSVIGEAFIPNKTVGKKADLFRRLFASVIDPIIVTILYMIFAAILGAVLGRGIALVIVTLGYVYFLSRLLSKGMTLGKWLLGAKVVEKLTGNNPGFWRMLLRETIGKGISGLVFGLGYFWAIWDKDGPGMARQNRGYGCCKRTETITVIKS